MSIVTDLSTISPNMIEAVEKLTMRWIFQSMVDFGMEPYAIFKDSQDEVDDVAEDITREALDRLPGFNLPLRIYGTVDYKRARYAILPDSVIKQALFVDSKAEKTDSKRSL